MASKVSGHRELARNLRKLAKFVERPIGEAQRVSLKPILDRARSNLRANKSNVTGDLSRSLAIRSPRSKAKGTKRALLGPTGKGRGKAHLVEFGTDPHWQPKLGKMHPGAKAKKFLTTAFESEQHIASKDFWKLLGIAMERQAARLNKKR